MKGIWPSERVNSQVEWLRADLSGTSAPSFTDKFFGRRQESKQTPHSDAVLSLCNGSSLNISSLLSSFFSHLANLSQAVSTVCSVTFPCFRFLPSFHVSLFLLASRALKRSSDTLLSWKDQRSRKILEFSKLNSYKTIWNTHHKEEWLGKWFTLNIYRRGFGRRSLAEPSLSTAPWLR